MIYGYELAVSKQTTSHLMIMNDTEENLPQVPLKSHQKSHKQVSHHLYMVLLEQLD
jgi:hypothetical protein